MVLLSGNKTLKLDYGFKRNKLLLRNLPMKKEIYFTKAQKLLTRYLATCKEESIYSPYYGKTKYYLFKKNYQNKSLFTGNKNFHFRKS